MARLTKADSVYRMSLHKNGGYMYATTHPYTVTGDGKRKYSCLHWGTVTDGLKFIPGKQYLYASPEERARLIFPEGWDLSEIDKLQSNRRQGRPAYEGADVNRFYGDVWLMERVADKVGLRTDLMATFHENAEIVNDVLTLAYYSFATGNSWSRAARWQKLEKAPSSRELTPMTITRLTHSISETERMNLFKYRADRLDKDELCAVDSTTRSAYGSSPTSNGAGTRSASLCRRLQKSSYIRLTAICPCITGPFRATSLTPEAWRPSSPTSATPVSRGLSW